MIARLAGLAIDARFAIPDAMPGVAEPVARARAARWIAANALATRGARVAIEGEPPGAPSLVALHAESLAAVLAAIAALPALIDTTGLPCRWRIALRALGLPALDRPAAAAMALGASVLTSAAVAPGAAAPGCAIAVDREWHCFRVRLGSPERTLIA